MPKFTDSDRVTLLLAPLMAAALAQMASQRGVDGVVIAGSAIATLALAHWLAVFIRRA